MGKLVSLLILPLLLAPKLAFAQSDEALRFCALFEKATAGTMRVRQSGVPISEAMENFNSQVKDRDDFRVKMMRESVIGAYSKPLWSTDEMKESAAIEFGNANYLKCIKMIKEIE
ncbi:MAG: hypothetical protein PHN76_06035 [Advenella sp.]|uniref:hypothetical protein n=1 Tax=Advenella sp. TaxID=1872388 RepID=UPI0025881A9C|nr:hypothetical protein [Advenella sp.]MDD3757706.1 hypothetical protein [Advenella sp.]